MQIGFVLLIAAIAIGAASATLEVARPKTAWCLMVLCGLLVFGAAYDVGFHPEEIARAYGTAAANVTIVFLWIAGVVIELMCLFWLARGLAHRIRR